MEIKLNWLRLKNFKGIKNFTLTADGKNIFVKADNGKGKTTVADAFFWLLFGKDSSGRDGKTAKIKPQDEKGNDIHHLQTEVEAELLVNGKPIKIRKMQEEKWTRKRGAETKELTGNITSYWWDEVPMKEGHFKQKVSELIDEKIFKMVTDPFYFNTQVKWQDRRNMLLEICGDATDEQVFQTDTKLSKLAKVLNGRSIDDFKEIVADKIRRLKKEKEDIPPRIDELTLGLPQEEEDYSAVEAEIQGCRDIITEIDAEMNDANKIVDAFRKKQQDLYGLKGRLENLKSKIQAEAGADRRKLLEKKAELEEGNYILESGIRTLKSRIQQSQEVIEANAMARKQLVEEWKKLKKELADCLSEEFVQPEHEEFICPACGQDLPAENEESRVLDLKNRFEENKNSKTKQIYQLITHNETRGQKIKASTIAEQNFIEEAQVEIEAKEKCLANILADIQRIESELSKPVAEPNYTDCPEYVELENQITVLQAELDKPMEDTTADLRQKKQEIQSKIDDLNAILKNKDRIEKDKNRIEELKAEEKRIAALITELEGHKYLMERFVVAKVNLLEDKINSRFKSVKFKMFEENISNDGITECCKAIVNTNGCYVPFEDANLAGQVNAGLDCIEALGSYYGVTAPIFIDNRESVSKIIETNSQIINLVKPPSWDELDKSIQCAIAGVEEKESPRDFTTQELLALESAKKDWNNKNKTLRVEVEQ